VECIGIDVSEPLIRMANASNNKDNVTFLHADILDKGFNIEKNIDLITCFGTAVCISDIGVLLGAMFRFKPKMIFFNDVINVNGLDVVVGYKRQNQTDYNFAYNIRCEQTWRELINEHTEYSIEFEPYKMESELKKSDNPIRNYHSNIDGELLQRNGLDLILRGHNIIFKRH
jgi:hypothetical protein